MIARNTIPGNYKQQLKTQFKLITLKKKSEFSFSCFKILLGAVEKQPSLNNANYSEFQQFEKQLEHCLSSTAVRTKFAAHTSRGKDIIERYLLYLALNQVLPFTISGSKTGFYHLEYPVIKLYFNYTISPRIIKYGYDELVQF